MFRISTALWLLVAVPAFSQNKKVEAQSTIQQVTVFSSGAQIIRTASVPVTPGRSEITFTGLSNQLDQQSIQLKADADITLLSVQTVKDFFNQRKMEEDERNLRERWNQAKARSEADHNELTVYKREEEMLSKNQAIGGQAGIKADDLKQALDLHRQRLMELFKKESEVNQRIKSDEQEIAALAGQLQEISKKRDSINYTVIALIDCKQTHNVKFELHYTIKDAGWYPSYDVRAAETNGQLEVLMNANVFQRSGETWKDVDLVLSTGNPSGNNTPSYLQPWMIGFNDPSLTYLGGQPVTAGTVAGRILDDKGAPITGATVSIRGYNMATQTDGNGFFKLTGIPVNAVIQVSSVGFESKQVKVSSGYYSISLTPASGQLNEVVVTGYAPRDLEGTISGVQISPTRAQKKQEDIQLVQVATQYQPTAVVYKIAEKYTLETNGKTTTISIKRNNIPAQFEYFTAPKIETASYLTARMINWQDYDLIPGEANLYFEGTFLGKTYLDLNTATDTLALAFGKDNGVLVTRKKVKEFTSKKFLGNTRIDTREFEITVRNTKKVSVAIHVQDQIPVSTNKEIEVEEVKAPDAEIDRQTGLVSWKLQLKPGEERTLHIGYEVKYPKDKRLVW